MVLGLRPLRLGVACGKSGCNGFGIEVGFNTESQVSPPVHSIWRCLRQSGTSLASVVRYFGYFFFLYIIEGNSDAAGEFVVSGNSMHGSETN